MMKAIMMTSEKSMHHIRPDKVSDGRAHSGELLTSATTGFGAGFGRSLKLCKLESVSDNSRKALRHMSRLPLSNSS